MRTLKFYLEVALFLPAVFAIALVGTIQDLIILIRRK